MITSTTLFRIHNSNLQCFYYYIFDLTIEKVSFFPCIDYYTSLS